MTYDLTTPVGQIRFLLNDVAEPSIFTDPELASALELARGRNVKRAAAMVIDINASNEVLASKVLRSQNVATDGAKAADALRKHAAALRAEADADDEQAEDESAGYFSIVNMGGTTCPPELTEHPRWYF